MFHNIIKFDNIANTVAKMNIFSLKITSLQGEYRKVLFSCQRKSDNWIWDFEPRIKAGRYPDAGGRQMIGPPSEKTRRVRRISNYVAST
ncbi:MAG: hypothetical protein CVU55_04325 [Deltaproteobacteria bacterium HGW-Deltaproteobacteria-13]|jgi:hypothetical protein|nr:MAG: hypothetical protein CVU55_04325 [Deltaproteobacteria bacterium HGW-Deltaproteobacteria-13]